MERVPTPTTFLIEGIDRLGKDTLIRGLLETLGYHLVLHYQKPLDLPFYTAEKESRLRSFQEESFRTLLTLIANRDLKIIANRAHLGEVVYAPRYRGYDGEYVFELEHKHQIARLAHVRLVLLTEDFRSSRHYVDDGRSLGSPSSRESEQETFIQAFHRSLTRDKRIVCVTDAQTGAFRPARQILEEVLS